MRAALRPTAGAGGSWWATCGICSLGPAELPWVAATAALTAPRGAQTAGPPRTRPAVRWLPDDLPAVVAGRRYREVCVLRPLCGRARRYGNGQPTCESGGQA